MQIKKCCKDCVNKGQPCSCYLAELCHEYVDDDKDTNLSFEYNNYINYKFEGDWKC